MSDHWIGGKAHHATLVERAGRWEVARPVRDVSWWQRRKTAKFCRRHTNHCWHPAAMIDWWCCMCSSETDGLPPQRCVYCVA